MNFNFLCTKDWIARDVPLQLWEATTADGPTASVWLTRFLHNKPMFYLNNFFRCHLSYLSPDFVTSAFSLLGLALFLFGLYQAVRTGRKWLLIPVLLAPLFPLLGFPPGNFIQGAVLYGSQLLMVLFGLHQILKIVRRKVHAP